MTGAEAVLELQKGLGFRSDKGAELLIALNQVQLKLETGPGSLAPFLIQENDPIILLAGADTMVLPTGFIRIVEEEGPSYTTLGRPTRFLTQSDYQRLVHLYGDTDDGYPVAYSLRKGSIVFFPPTLNALTLAWSWYKHDDPITLVAENGWLANYPYIVIAEAGLPAARMLRDKEAERIFSSMLSEWKPRLFADIERREGSNRDYYMGERN